MRQVPKNQIFTLIGSGQLACHLSHYFQLKKISHLKWSRNSHPKFNSFSKISDNQRRLQLTLEQSDIALLAISDDSLRTFSQDLLLKSKKTLVHFSGAIHIDGVLGAHPLMTFSQTLYELSVYENLAFIIDFEVKKFKKIFKNLSNPCYQISPDLKPLYHSLCVASGNFSQILWQEVFNQFQNKLDLPSEVLLPYLNQVFLNISKLQNFETGPLHRKDTGSIRQHLKALEQNNLQKIYQDFVEMKGIHL